MFFRRQVTTLIDFLNALESGLPEEFLYELQRGIERTDVPLGAIIGPLDFIDYAFAWEFSDRESAGNPEYWPELSNRWRWCIRGGTGA